MFMIGISGVNLLTGGDDDLFPDLQTIEALADDAFMKADSDNSGAIGYEEFLSWARSNRDLMAAVECLHKAAHEAKVDVQPEDSAPDTDEGELSDAEAGLEYGATVAKTSKHSDDHITATPSVLHRGSVYTPDKGYPHDSRTLPTCHLYLKDGQIQFLADCTHSLAGKTVPMEDF